MVGVIGVNHRIFRTLARAGISVFFVSQAASENTTSIGLRNEDADLAIAMLTREFAPEIEIGEVGSITAEHDLATIAVVGDDMKHTPGIAASCSGRWDATASTSSPARRAPRRPTSRWS